MTIYLIGYFLAYALTLYSTYLEEKWFKIMPMTPMDVLLVGGMFITFMVLGSYS